MLRISLIIAIVAGLAAAGLNFYKVREVIVTTMKERDDEKAAKEQAQNDLAKTRKTLTKTEEDLASTKKKLETTETALNDTRDKLAASERQVASLNTDVERCRTDRDTAQQELESWRQIGLNPLQVKGVIADLKKSREAVDALTDENQKFGKKIKQLTARIASLTGGDNQVVEMPGLKGHVVAVDPKYDFVVLDVGEDQGALERGEMLVNRNGKLIGKVRISSVSKSQSIANLIPEWKAAGAEIMEGDQVLY